VVAAAVWAAAEPAIARLVRAPAGYSDLRLLGAPVTGDGARWREVGLAVHLANGAVFGALFAAAGGRGWKQGFAAAQAENLALWPAMAVVDRVHPDRRNGTWPPLVGNGRVFAHEAAVHALFGLVLGALARN
jgi:hypothetical protein